MSSRPYSTKRVAALLTAVKRPAPLNVPAPTNRRERRLLAKRLRQSRKAAK